MTMIVATYTLQIYLLLDTTKFLILVGTNRIMLFSNDTISYISLEIHFKRDNFPYKKMLT